MKRRPSTSRARRRALTIPSCKHFTGYKPCYPGARCLDGCVDYQPVGTRILIVNLDAMGNVLLTTSILPALKRKYPESTVNWITLRAAAPLLQNNPYIDNVFSWDPESWLILREMKFDVVMNVDKAQRSCAFTGTLDAREKLGFGLNPDGVIVPLNREARENYELGLDDHLKFRVNQKPLSRILCEQFRLKYRRDEYTLVLTPEEQAFCSESRARFGIEPGDFVVGFNTGCSELYPNKKMTIDQHLLLIESLSMVQGVRLVLVGGPEDTERNAEIARRAGAKVINTPTTEGVRKGILYENLCDLVITGDSFGMHIAIALRKYVLAWFGVSCWTEVDLFDRGEKLIPEGLECSPCWKRSCPYNLECIQMIDLDAIVRHVEEYRAKWEAAPAAPAARG